MSEKETKEVQSPEELSDILLVLDQDKKKIQAVKGVGKNGELETVDVNKNNESEFMRVDKQGDIFSNFFSNFWRNLKHPARFSFFKVPAAQVYDVAPKIQKQVDKPTKEGEEVMAKHAVKEPKKQQQDNKKTEEASQTQTTPQTKPEKNEYRFDPKQIDWETMNNMGLSRERLEKAQQLEPLLKGYRTDLLPVSVNLGGTVIARMDARLSLHMDGNGKPVVAIHGIRKEPDFNSPFFGHEFSKEDKENLLKTGNMGRVVELTNTKTGEKIPSIVSIDKQTNEFVALRQDWMKIPEVFKDVTLSAEQKQDLKNGKSVNMEGMISKKGEPFSAPIQYNAVKRCIEFLFDRSNAKKQTQSHQQGPPFEAPDSFRGVKLTAEQYEKYNAEKFTYIDGLTNKEGREYRGYIKFNKQTGETAFSFQNPDKMKEKVQSADVSKTQSPTNPEKKNNESTKNVQKPPLKPKQQVPKEKRQQQQNTSKAPARSKGRRA